MKKIILPIIIFTLIIFGLNLKPTPDSHFYILKTIGENIREFLAFSPQAKAQLQVALAGERMAEIQYLLTNPGDHTQILNFVETKMQKNLATIAAILTLEKQKGKDISQLSKTLSRELNLSHDTLSDSIQAQEIDLKNQVRLLETQINQAQKTGNAIQTDALKRQMADTQMQLMLLETKEDKLDAGIDNEEEKIEAQMDLKQEISDKIAELTTNKNKYFNKNASISFNKFDSLMLEAKSAFDKGNYEQAKQLLKNAEQNFNAVEKSEN